MDSEIAVMRMGHRNLMGSCSRNSQMLKGSSGSLFSPKRAVCLCADVSRTPVQILRASGRQLWN